MRACNGWTKRLSEFAWSTPRLAARRARHEATLLVSRFNIANDYLIPAGVRPMALAIVRRVLRERRGA